MSDRISTVVGLGAALSLGLASGAVLAEAVVLVPYWRSMPPEAFLDWYVANAARLLEFYGPLEIVSALLAIAAAVVYLVRRQSGAGLMLIAAVLAVAVIAAYPLYFRDVNASFEDRSIALDSVAATLSSWAAWHWFRTALGTGAFVAALLAVRRSD